jgi:hypothetical protein
MARINISNITKKLKRIGEIGRIWTRIWKRIISGRRKQSLREQSGRK